MMMVITSLIVSPLSRRRCFLPSLNRGCFSVQLRQSSLAKFVAVNKELYNVNLDSPFCGWYFWREFIAFLTQKGVPRLNDRAYLLTLLQLLHRTHVIVESLENIPRAFTEHPLRQRARPAPALLGGYCNKAWS